MINKKIILVVAGLVAIIALFLLVDRQINRFDPGTQTRVDQDTGRTIISNKNLSEEKFAAATITLLGGEYIYKYMSDQQFQTVRQGITEYLNNNLDSSVEVVKVLKDSVTSENEHFVNAKLKIDEPEITMDLRIEISGTRLVRLTFSNSSDKQLPKHTTDFLPDTILGPDETIGH